MNKIISSILLIISFILLAGCTQGGATLDEKESIKGTSIDWSIFDEYSIPGILDIKINNKQVEEVTEFLQIAQVFDKNSMYISDKKKEGYVPVFVEFDNAGTIQQSYEPTKYDKKKTSFYIKESVVQKYSK